LESAKMRTPQSWNRYSYVGNNPLLYTDPTGMDWYIKYKGNSITPVWRKNWDGVSHLWSSRAGFVYRDQYGTYTVLNPFEGRSRHFNTFREAQGQLRKYQHQAAKDFIAGAIEGGTISGSLAGLFIDGGIDRNSNMYELGAKGGNLLSYVAAVTGGGAIAVGVLSKVAKIRGLEGQLAKIFTKYPADSFKCDTCAKEVVSAFREAGLKADIIRLVDNEGVPFLKDAAGNNIAETGFHEVVKVGDRYFDALTQRAGLTGGATWEQYLKLWHPDTAKYLTPAK
jgi:hypothetical protein